MSVATLGADLETLNHLYNNATYSQAQRQGDSGPGAAAAVGPDHYGIGPLSSTHGGAVGQPLMLHQPAGDGEPVSDREKGHLFFDYDSEHLFPSSRTLARTAAFFGLPYPIAVFLCLKGAWEAACAAGYAESASRLRASGSPAGAGNRGTDLFAGDFCTLLATIVENDAVRHDVQFRGRFLSSLDAIRRELEALKGYWPGRSLGPEELEALARDLLLADSGMPPLCNEEAMASRDTGIADLASLQAVSVQVRRFAGDVDDALHPGGLVSGADKEKFFITRVRWIGLREEVTDLGYAIERIQHKHRNIKMSWTRLFGDALVALTEAAGRLEMAHRCWAVIESDPDGRLTPEKLEELVAAAREEEQRKLEAAKIDAWTATGLHVEIRGELGHVDPELLAEYERKCREIIDQLVRLTHYDARLRKPEAQKLSDEQIAKLDEICRQSLRIRRGSVSNFRPGQIGWDTPSYEFLARMLREVREIYERAGLDTDPGNVIPADKTPSERIEWLEEEIEWLEHLRRDLLADLENLHETERHGEVAKWQSDIDDPRRHDEIREHYMNYAQAADAEAAKLEAEVERWQQERIRDRGDGEET
jgi:hypothetical protein